MERVYPEPMECRRLAGALEDIAGDLRELAYNQSWDESRSFLECLPERLERIAWRLEGRPAEMAGVP
jgi:hypothetical protein